MTINIIASVIFHKNKFIIGNSSKNDLIYHIKEDLKNFKAITTKKLNDTTDNKNIIVMGYNTWESLPPKFKPLSDRINIVLTNNINLHNYNPESDYLLDRDLYFMSFYEFIELYQDIKGVDNIFVIGGGSIYDLFFNEPSVVINKVYLTEIKPVNFVLPDNPVYLDINNFDSSYQLIDHSKNLYDEKNNVNFRFLTYLKTDSVSDEIKYINLCKKILNEGSLTSNRTGIDTISIFCDQLHFDISNCVPLLTTKRVPWKHTIYELLWFLRGDTDNKVLQKDGVKIWNGNSSRSFLDSRGLHHYPEGVIGAGYGWQLRFFSAQYDPKYADTSKFTKDELNKIKKFDQLEYVVNELKTNPTSRRILISYWNPSQLKDMALPPCHYTVVFNVQTINNEKYLNCHFSLRGNDEFLGFSFNVFSYAAMTYIIALKCDMKPGKLVYTVTDAHIYTNHINQMKEQLKRKQRPFPKLLLNPEIKNKDWSEITIEDFEIIGYFPHPAIKAPMAI